MVWENFLEWEFFLEGPWPPAPLLVPPLSKKNWSKIIGKRFGLEGLQFTYFVCVFFCFQLDGTKLVAESKEGHKKPQKSCPRPPVNERKLYEKIVLKKNKKLRSVFWSVTSVSILWMLRFFSIFLGHTKKNQKITSFLSFSVQCMYVHSVQGKWNIYNYKFNVEVFCGWRATVDLLKSLSCCIFD